MRAALTPDEVRAIEWDQIDWSDLEARVRVDLRDMLNPRRTPEFSPYERTVTHSFGRATTTTRAIPALMQAATVRRRPPVRRLGRAQLVVCAWAALVWRRVR